MPKFALRTPLNAREHVETPPSKTKRKQAMHDLQDLGEALVKLDPAKLAQIDLPESLRDAVADARGITKWEARRRQMQYIGRLMREVDPEPIRAELARWEGGSASETALLHELERTREHLLADPAALDALHAAHPTLDRAHWRTLIQRAKDEHARGLAPKAYRQLFRELRTLGADSAEESESTGQ